MKVKVNYCDWDKLWFSNMIGEVIEVEYTNKPFELSKYVLSDINLIKELRELRGNPRANFYIDEENVEEVEQ